MLWSGRGVISPASVLEDFWINELVLNVVVIKDDYIPYCVLCKLLDGMDDNCVSLWMVIRGIIMREMQTYRLVASQEAASSLLRSRLLNSCVMDGMDENCVSLWMVLRVITMRDANIPTACRPGRCQQPLQK